MIVDGRVHVSRPEHEHEWVLEFGQSQPAGDLLDLMEEALTPAGIRRFLQENSIDSYIRRNVEATQALPLEADTKEKILGGNAARILGLDN